MNFPDKYFSETFDLVEMLKSSEKDFVAVVWDRVTKKLCVMKQRALTSQSIYRTLREIDDPHVPKIYRLIEADGKLIVVEEHIDGQTLEEAAIYRAEPFDEKFAANILVNLCDYLTVIHAKNIVHRDIKPANIMLTDSGEVKLIDFGIARVFKPAARADTEILGTRGYAPPEQFGLFGLGQTDSRSDIYSLGVTIKTLLGEDYRGRLSDILNRCTSPDPAQRFQSAAELKAAVLRSEKFYSVKKFLLAALICPIAIFIPNVANRAENFVEPEISIAAPEVQTPAAENPVTENSAAKNPVAQFPAIKIPETPSPVPIQNSKPQPEIKSLPEPAAQKKITAKPRESFDGIDLFLYLNGALTGTDGSHLVEIGDWQNWNKFSNGVLFPAGWNALLHVENNGVEDLIAPVITVDVGDDEYSIEKPTLKVGQSLDLNIPLGDKFAAPIKGSGHLQIVLQPQGKNPIFLNRTFQLAH